VALTRREILDLIDRHGLRPSRALGQNFVADPNTVRRIVRLAEVEPGDRVVEVGAGLGSLTLELAEAGAEVLAIERDRHIVPVLRSVVEPAGVRVLEADALSLDWDAALDGDAAESRPWRLVANLPYNVAVPLILDVLERVPAVRDMFVMVQREVGERLAAGAGDEAYGAVSVKVSYWASASLVARVPPTVFVPRPKVESALVRVRRRPNPAVDVDRRVLFDLVEAGFAQRRKMLRRSLAGRVDESAFHAAGVRPDARAEELDVQDWARLARCVTNSAPSPS
jgi:16S rRNA (adenine1518-N6/adenine1519-N6)-dimethyltransferase